MDWLGPQSLLSQEKVDSLRGLEVTSGIEKLVASLERMPVMRSDDSPKDRTEMGDMLDQAHCEDWMDDGDAYLEYYMVMALKVVERLQSRSGRDFGSWLR